MLETKTDSETHPVKARPYPWRCPKCGQKEVRRTTIAYRSEVRHDGKLHVVDTPQLSVPRCGNCGELVFDIQADDEISQTLRTQLRLLHPEQIRAGRMRIGLSEKELADRLGVEELTVSHWETGALIQSRAMDNLLRVYFAVPQVRQALVGVNQDPMLGTSVVEPAGK